MTTGATGSEIDSAASEPVCVAFAHDNRLLADLVSEELVREGTIRLRHLLSLEELEATDVEPDCQILLVDASRRRDRVLQAMRLARSSRPAMKVIPIGVSSRGEALDFIEEGAQGCVLSTDGMDVLLAAIDAARRGRARCPPEVAGRFCRRVRELVRSVATPKGEPSVSLTSREKEVLRLLVKGLSNKEIASRLGIRSATAKNHVHNILEKLSASHRRGAARIAIERGLVKPSL